MSHPAGCCIAFVSRLAIAICCGIAGLTAAVAAPSGGPYGPSQRRYEIPSAPHVYHVAPDGKADASGSSPEQATRLDSALARAVTGDVIVLRGGVYRIGGLQVNQGVTLQPFADERPILKGTEVAANWVAQSNGLWRTAWSTLFPARPADWWRRDRQARLTPLYLFNNDMVFFDGELLAAVGSEREVTEKSYFIDYETGDVYLGRDPKGHLVEITAHDSALVRTIKEVHGKTNDRKGIVLRGITFTQYAYRALEIEGKEPDRHMDPALFGKDVVGSLLEDVTVSFCSRVAGYLRGDKLVVRNCLIADCGTEGLYVIDSADVLLERNIITRTNSAENITGYFASAIKIFNQSYRVTCRDNLVIDNPHASGIWYDVGNVDGVFVDNWIEHTDDGFFFEISKGAICAGNVFVNCDRGIHILNSSNVQVYQNTLYNSVVKIERTERSAVADHFGWHPSAGPEVTERHGHVFQNNLCVADEQFEGPLLAVVQTSKVDDQLRDSPLKSMDGNVYVRRAGAKPQPLIAFNPVAETRGSTDFPDLAAFQRSFPSLEKMGKTFPNYWGPLFSSVELHRFHVLPEFPAASSGTVLPETVRGLLKLPASTNSFPGAYPPASNR